MLKVRYNENKTNHGHQSWICFSNEFPKLQSTEYGWGCWNLFTSISPLPSGAFPFDMAMHPVLVVILFLNIAVLYDALNYFLPFKLNWVNYCELPWAQFSREGGLEIKMILIIIHADTARTHKHHAQILFRTTIGTIRDQQGQESRPLGQWISELPRTYFRPHFLNSVLCPLTFPGSSRETELMSLTWQQPSTVIRLAF